VLGRVHEVAAAGEPVVGRPDDNDDDAARLGIRRRGGGKPATISGDDLLLHGGVSGSQTVELDQI
jgi:hypothetical protein